MKKTIPVILFAAVALCGCKGENDAVSESSTVSTTIVTATVISTTESSAETTTASTVGTTLTTSLSKEVTTSSISNNNELIEDGIIPPEVEEVFVDDETPQATFPVSEDDKPIELPIIPIG